MEKSHEEYLCPSCSREIEFAENDLEVKCSKCKETFGTSTIKEYNESLQYIYQSDEMEWKNFDNTAWLPSQKNMVISYACPTCDTEIIATKSEEDPFCPYCKEYLNLGSELGDDLFPQLIIPFKFDDDKAIRKFIRHLRRKKLLPSSFRRDIDHDEIMKVYIPAFLFDCDVTAKSAYRAEKISNWKEKKSRVVETKRFRVVRNVDLSFSKLAISASSKIPEDFLEALEPFDYKDCRKFVDSDLKDFVCSRYDIKHGEVLDKAEKRIKDDCSEIIGNTISGFTSARHDASVVKLTDDSAKYILYPIYLLSLMHNDEEYLYAMNGQTGKFSGNLPLSIGKFIGTFASILAIVGGLTFYLTGLL